MWGERILLLGLAWIILSAAPENMAAGNASTDVEAGAKADSAKVAPPPEVASTTQVERCPDLKATNGPEICAAWRAAQASQEAVEVSRNALLWNIAAFAAVLATLIATAWASWAATRAARAADRSVKLAEDTAKRQLRAYVLPSKFKIAGLLAGQRPRITYLLRNVGQTPAHEVRLGAIVVWGASDASPHFMKIRFPKAAESPSKTVLGAGEEADARMVFASTITGELADALRSGASTMVMGGAISYRDIFKRRRLVTFKVYLDSMHIEEDGNAHFTVCSRGNSAN